MLENNCSKFIDTLASKAPVPGGGGACAYVGALGMALGSMVGNLTIENSKYADVQEDVKDLLTESSNIIEALKEFVAKDAECFYPLIQAYKLPRDTDDEKKYRNDTIQEKLKDASTVPLEIARCCARAITLHEQFAKKGNLMAISDIGVGAAFCEAALRGAKLNVLINTSQIKNEALKNDIEKEIMDIEKEFVNKSKIIFSYVENIITRR